MRFRTTCLVCMLLLAVVPPGSGNVVSNFTSGDEGWKVGTTGGGTHNPYWDSGGYIYTPDPDGQATYWVAPQKFLGSKAGFYNKDLKFQELVVPAEGSTLLDPNAAALIGLQGANGIWLSYFANVTPTSIHDFVVPIKAGSSYGWHKGTNNTDPWASYSDMMGVLGNLSGVYLKAEYYAGGETNYLDNVEFTPEPCGLICLIPGLAGLAATRRRQK